MISFQKLFIIILFLIPTVAQSAVPSLSVLADDVKQITNQNPYSPRGLWPFMGVGVGGVDYSKQFGDKDGTNMNIRLIGTYYSDHKWNYDMAMGLQGSQLGDGNVSAGMVELAGRYKLMNRWSMGPASVMYVGNGEEFGSRFDNMTIYVGAAVLKDIPIDSTHLLRAGGKLMTDVSIPDSMSNMVMFEVQIGFPFEGEQKPLVQKKKSTKPVENSLLADIAIEKNTPHFDNGKIEPNAEGVQYIDSIATQLAKYPNMFEKIIIHGHADARGGDKINQTLSESRAQAIAKRLALAGVPASKIQAMGFGEQKPKFLEKNEKAYSKNRRVEIEIIGVKNSKGMKKLLKQ